MAELALGVLGIAGLFSATLDVWSFVDAGQGYAQSFTRLRTRLDLQRTLFMNWGKTVGFGTEEGYHPKLDEPYTQPIIRQVLTEIYLILSETDRLASKYGLRVLDTSEEPRPVAIGRRLLPSGLSARSLSESIFRPKYEEYRLRLKRLVRGGEPPEIRPEGGVELAAALQAEAIRERQRNSSVWMKTKWAVRDEEKMEKLVRDLAELVSGLRTLTIHIVDDGIERAIAAETVSDIDSVDSLRQIQEAASREASPLSVSVSERIRSLESGPSGATTFYSALSRHSDVAITDSVYGTSQLPRGTFFPESRFPRGPQHRKLEPVTSSGVQRRLSESAEEPDLFTHERDSGSRRDLNNPRKEATSIWESGDKQPMTPESASRPTDEIHNPSVTTTVKAESSPDLNGQFQMQDLFSLEELADSHLTVQEPSEGVTDALVGPDSRAPSMSTLLPTGTMDGPIAVWVDGPASTPYFGGGFRMYAWLGEVETAEIGEKKVAVRYIYVRVLTRICHPLIDTGGYVHGRYFLHSDPPDKAVLSGVHHSIATMMTRVLRYSGWESAQGGEGGRVDQLQNIAREYTRRYAPRYARLLPHESTGLKRPPWVAARTDAENHDTLLTEGSGVGYNTTPSLMEKLLRESIEQETWEVSGTDGVRMVLLRYPSEPMWEGQFIPEVGLKASNPSGIFIAGSLLE